MVLTTVKLVSASINKGEIHKKYIAIENNNGILLVDDGLFVISFNCEEQIPYYETIKEISNNEYL